MTAKEETQTFCEWICIINTYTKFNKELMHVCGGSYWFFEDCPPNSNNFLPVIDIEGFPVVKLCRVDR